MAASAVFATDGFDFPVGYPDGVGWNNGSGCVGGDCSDQICQDGYCFLEPAYYNISGCILHPGEDWNKDCGGACDADEPVHAIADGVVEAIPVQTCNWGTIVIRHENVPEYGTLWSVYGHVRTATVVVGQTVARGDVISWVSNNGTAAYHLHLEIRRGDIHTDHLLPCFFPHSSAKGGWGDVESEVTERYLPPTEFINAHRPFPCTPNHESAKLLPSDGTAGDFFGKAVAINGDTAIVGAPDDDDNGIESGSAYVFRFNGTSWSQDVKLLPTDGAANDYFGYSVSISGDAAIVGAYDRAAYLFRYDGAMWQLESKLLPADIALGDRFGCSVSIDGNYVVVGAYRGRNLGIRPGSAYVFRFDGASWQLATKLLQTDGAQFDHFGWSVAISGDRAVVGAYWDDDSGTRAGSAYIFHSNGTDWSQEAKLLASDGDSGNGFGFAVALSDATVMVGAPNALQGGVVGAAYMFRRSNAIWSQEARIAPSINSGGSYGSVVSCGEDVAIIGDFISGWLLRLNGSNWCQNAKLLPADGAQSDLFSYSVACDRNRAIIGAPSDYYGNTGGSAYIFDLNAPASHPAVTQQPANRSVGTGGTAVFNVAASGTAPLSYQWYRAGVRPLADDGRIVGANTATLTINSVQQSDAGAHAKYFVMVSNACGDRVASQTAKLEVRQRFGPLPSAVIVP